MSSKNEEFNRVVAESHINLRCFIRGTGVNAADVDDIAQDTYLAYYQKMDGMPSDAHPMAWLKGIARNKCLDYFRKTKTRRSKLHELIANQLDDTGESDAQEKEGAIAALLDCVKKLPEKMNKIILLKYRQQFTCDSIGEEMEQTPGTVRKNMYRARLMLKQCIDNQLQEQL